jgi:ATP-dependent DNA helicase RecG
VRYQHNDRTAGRQEKEFAEGYARTFAQAVDWIIATLPSEEALTTGREDRTLVPRIAITELLANAMIHQDLEVSGAGALVELFDDRFEITNPGAPIVPAERMLDGAAHSRNEHMARRCGRCSTATSAAAGSTRSRPPWPRGANLSSSRNRIDRQYGRRCLAKGLVNRMLVFRAWREV